MVAETNIIELALAAYKRKQEQDNLKEIERQRKIKERLDLNTEQTRKLFSEHFGVEPENVSGNTVSFDEIIIVYDESTYHWHAHKLCKNHADNKQHKFIASTGIWREDALAYLGQFIEDNKDALCWECQNPSIEDDWQNPVRKTTEQELAEVLRRFIQENTYQEF